MDRRLASRSRVARRVALALWAASLAAGCTAADSTMTGPSASAPTIADDPDGDIVGGTCIIHAAGFDVGAANGGAWRRNDGRRHLHGGRGARRQRHD